MEDKQFLRVIVCKFADVAVGFLEFLEKFMALIMAQSLSVPL